MSPEFNILALSKGPHKFVFIFDDESLNALVDTFRDQASDPSLELNWFDAAVLADKAKEQTKVAEPRVKPTSRFL
ncbi:MAG: hypothetical protein ACFCD0_06035 [Gemmataceae bacterium]